MRMAEHGSEMLSAVSDTALMCRVAAGDAAAFEVVYRRYLPRVRAFLSRVVRCRPFIEDALHETMLVVWRRARTFDTSTRASTWIFAIAYRKGLQAMQRSDAIAARERRAANDDEFIPGPDSELQRHEVRQRVARALTALSRDHRDVLRLVYFQGYRCRDVALLMRCPLATVKTRAFHARRKLRASLVELRDAVA